MRRGKLRVAQVLPLVFIFGFSFLAESFLQAQTTPANGQTTPANGGDFSGGASVRFADTYSSCPTSSQTFESGVPTLHPAEGALASGRPTFRRVSEEPQPSEVYGSGFEGKKLFSSLSDSSDSPSDSVSGENSGDKRKKSKYSSAVGVKKLAFSVAAVTLLFFILLLLLKKFSPEDAPKLPKEAFEILGKSQLAFRHQLYLMRCGEKLFIVSISQNGVDRIGEIEDPLEADRIARLCRGEVLGTENLKKIEELRSRRNSGETLRKPDA